MAQFLCMLSQIWSCLHKLRNLLAKKLINRVFLTLCHLYFTLTVTYLLHRIRNRSSLLDLHPKIFYRPLLASLSHNLLPCHRHTVSIILRSLHPLSHIPYRLLINLTKCPISLFPFVIILNRDIHRALDIQLKKLYSTISGELVVDFTHRGILKSVVHYYH